MLHNNKFEREVIEMPVKTPASVPEGTTVPDFELRSLSGEMVKPSDYRGKRLVIFFWASW